jgi:hypothetical protein
LEGKLVEHPSCINICNVCPVEAVGRSIEKHCKPRGELRVKTQLHSSSYIVIDISFINRKEQIPLFAISCVMDIFYECDLFMFVYVVDVYVRFHLHG